MSTTLKARTGSFCVDEFEPDVSGNILEYCRRFSIEEMFKDLKGVSCLGSQEVRKWESCKVRTTVTTMGFTAVEIETWERKLLN